MENAGEVKAGIARFGAVTKQQAREIDAIVASMNRTAELLRALSPADQHQDIVDALAGIEEIKGRLARAAWLGMAVAHEADEYAARI